MSHTVIDLTFTSSPGPAQHNGGTGDSERVATARAIISDNNKTIKGEDTFLLPTAAPISDVRISKREKKNQKKRRVLRKGIGALIQRTAMASENSSMQTTQPSSTQQSFSQSFNMNSSTTTQPLSKIPPSMLDIIPPLHAVLAPLTLDTLDAKQVQIDTTQVQLRIERIRAAIARLPAAESSVDELREEVRAAEERVAKQKAIFRSLGESGAKKDMEV